MSDHYECGRTKDRLELRIAELEAEVERLRKLASGADHLNDISQNMRIRAEAQRDRLAGLLQLIPIHRDGRSGYWALHLGTSLHSSDWVSQVGEALAELEDTDE